MMYDRIEPWGGLGFTWVSHNVFPNGYSLINNHFINIKHNFIGSIL